MRPFFIPFNFMIFLFIVASTSPEFKDAWNTFLKRKGNALCFTVKLQTLLNIFSRIETALLKEGTASAMKGEMQ